MTLDRFLFYFFSSFGVISSFMVITLSNAVHSVLFLIIVFATLRITFIGRCRIFFFYVFNNICRSYSSIVFICCNDVKHKKKKIQLRLANFLFYP